MKNEKNEILIEKYNKYKTAYYEGSPLISDEEFDAYEKFLIDNMIIDDIKIGYVSDGSLVKHDQKMKSLKKTRTVDDILKLKSEELYVSFKLDGNAISIIFENGIPIKMLTRGDGINGHDISNRIPYLSLPNKNLLEKCRFEVRGELVITDERFQQMNSFLDKPYTSKRNAVAGITNPYRKDKIDLIKYCDFIPYDIICKDLQFKTELHKMRSLHNVYGFKRIPAEVINNDQKEIDQYIEFYKNYIYEYDTDGLVFVVNKIKDQETFSENENYPLYKLAYKLENDFAVTKVKDLEFEIGVSGKLSIVAIVDPVELASSTINRVTCYNVNYIKENKIGKNTIIEIIRSGEIIPKITRIVDNSNYEEIDFPMYCPECDSQLEFSETGIDLFCSNYNCSGRKIKAITKFIEMLDIKGISNKTVEKLYESCGVKNVWDLNQLTYEKLISVNGFENKTANNILQSINNIKPLTISIILRSLAIPNIGKTISSLMEKYIHTLFELSTFDVILTDQQKSSFGTITYQTLLNYRNIIIDGINGFCKNGWKFEEKQNHKPENTSSLDFIITGKLTKPRKEIEKDIISAGHNISSSVKSDVILVCNEQDSDSSKMKNAKKLNCKIITENELYNHFIINL